MLTIRSTAWYFRIYAWWREDRGQHIPDQVNLCPFMRVILFRSWMRFLLVQGEGGKARLRLNILSWLGVVLAFDSVVFVRFAKAPWGRVLGTEALVLLCAFILVGCFWLHDKYRARNPKKKQKTGPTFVDLCQEWVDGVHNKVCPILKVEGER